MIDTVTYRKETARGMGACLDSIAEESIVAAVKAVQEAPRIFFTGAGRSFLMIKGIAMCFMQVGVKNCYVTGDVTTPSIGAGDLLIAASCSGETKSVALFLEQAKAQGAKILLLTANKASAMGKMADYVIEMASDTEAGAEQEKWLCDNRFEHSIVPLGDCMMEYIARDKGAADNIIQQNHANIE